MIEESAAYLLEKIAKEVDTGKINKVRAGMDALEVLRAGGVGLLAKKLGFSTPKALLASGVMLGAHAGREALRDWITHEDGEAPRFSKKYYTSKYTTGKRRAKDFVSRCLL